MNGCDFLLAPWKHKEPRSKCSRGLNEPSIEWWVDFVRYCFPETWALTLCKTCRPASSTPILHSHFCTYWCLCKGTLFCVLLITRTLFVNIVKVINRDSFATIILDFFHHPLWLVCQAYHLMLVTFSLSNVLAKTP